MSGNFLIDWPALAISLFNTTLLVWLGLTVLFNSEKRTWGVWIAGDGLLIAAAFFTSHSVFLGEGMLMTPHGLNFWWYASWWPIVASPLAWYLLTLWFSGFWDKPLNPLFRRQIPWLVATIIFTLLLGGLILYANPLPVLSLDARINLTKIPSIGGVPLLVIGYPLYILTCISLALDSLIRPAPSSRLMGDQARRQARPWLISTSLVLLAVSFLVGWVMLWVVRSAGQDEPFYMVYSRLSASLALYDLVLEILITGATIMLGQAIINYEIFTGQTLPRRGFKRQWFNAILLAAGMCVVTTFSLDFNLNPIYIILLALMVMTVFFALVSWRTQVERRQSMGQLRPFVTSQRLYEHILKTPVKESYEINLAIPFAAICRDVLATQQAALLPLGPFALLSDTPMVFPSSNACELPDQSSLLPQLNDPHKIIPLQGSEWAGYNWAVSLWSERGLIGVLLVGPKTDGGAYTQEEIEIARANGERLLDILAGAEMARRLVEIQRQRMAESQLLDRQTRRVLHDDVLPLIHAALLALNGPEGSASSGSQEISRQLVEAHHKISDLLHAIPSATPDELNRLGLVPALRQVLEGELAAAFDSVLWNIDPKAEESLSALSSLSLELMYYAAREVMRNSARHARSAGSHSQLNLKVSLDWQDGPGLTIEDNGIGLALSGRDRNATPLSSGQGLALHSTLLAVVGGSLVLESIPGQYTRVKITLPQ